MWDELVYGSKKGKKWSDEAEESYDLILRRAAGMYLRKAGGGNSIWSGRKTTE